MEKENSYSPLVLKSPDTGGGSGNPDYARQVIRRLQENHLEMTAYTVFDLPRFKLEAALEEAELLPVPVDPNPHDIDAHEDLYDQWWRDHPEESEEHHQVYERRENIERLLYYGSKINEISDQRMYNTWSLPETFTKESIAAFIKKEKNTSMLTTWMMEDRLKKEGLLEVLEESGIIPQKNADQKENIQPNAINRQEALSYLHTGVVLSVLTKYLTKMKITVQ